MQSICIVVQHVPRSIEAKENMYLGINEFEMLPHHGMFIHLLIVYLDEEWHAICHQ